MACKPVRSSPSGPDTGIGANSLITSDGTCLDIGATPTDGQVLTRSGSTIIGTTIAPATPGGDWETVDEDFVITRENQSFAGECPASDTLILGSLARPIRVSQSGLAEFYVSDITGVSVVVSWIFFTYQALGAVLSKQVLALAGLPTSGDFTPDIVLNGGTNTIDFTVTSVAANPSLCYCKLFGVRLPPFQPA